MLAFFLSERVALLKVNRKINADLCPDEKFVKLIESVRYHLVAIGIKRRQYATKRTNPLVKGKTT